MVASGATCPLLTWDHKTSPQAIASPRCQPLRPARCGQWDRIPRMGRSRILLCFAIVVQRAAMLSIMSRCSARSLPIEIDQALIEILSQGEIAALPSIVLAAINARRL